MVVETINQDHWGHSNESKNSMQSRMSSLSFLPGGQDSLVDFDINLDDETLFQNEKISLQKGTTSTNKFAGIDNFYQTMIM